MTTRNLS